MCEHVDSSEQKSTFYVVILQIAQNLLTIIIKSTIISMRVIIMISFLSNRLADFLCAKGIVPEDEKEIYVYGYEMIITTILGAVLVFGIALLTGRLAEAFCFFVVFVTTRQFCGGYHSKTRIMCSMTFLTCYAAVLFFDSALITAYTWFVHLIVFVPYFAAILGYAPIVNDNKPLTNDEVKINHKKSIIVSIVWFAISTLLLFIKPILSSAIDFTLLIIAVLMIIEVIKRKEGDI